MDQPAPPDAPYVLTGSQNFLLLAAISQSLAGRMAVLRLLPPHHANFSKRLIKAHRLCFYDTGLACSLLGIREGAQLASHYLRGGLFENLVLTEILKHYDALGQVAPVYFWQNNTGREVDFPL